MSKSQGSHNVQKTAMSHMHGWHWTRFWKLPSTLHVIWPCLVRLVQCERCASLLAACILALTLVVTFFLVAPKSSSINLTTSQNRRKESLCRIDSLVVSSCDFSDGPLSTCRKQPWQHAASCTALSGLEALAHCWPLEIRAAWCLLT